MYSSQILTAFAALLSAAGAVESPVYTGYNRLFQATFIGTVGTLPSADNWNIINTAEVFNNEYQTYTNSPANVRFGGGGSLQLVPFKNSTAVRGWTSGRIESKASWTPAAGKITRFESRLRTAGNPPANKQGIWPAFWLLGNSYRTSGVKWPGCGEIDIFENINGLWTVWGVVHCDVAPGGACNEPNGLVNTTTLPDNNFHTYRVDVSRVNTDWRQQTITWYKDGVQFNQVTGSRVNNEAVWKTLAQSPMYMILNVAVGGDWSGPPNANTWDSYGSMMEVLYVSVYAST